MDLSKQMKELEGKFNHLAQESRDLQTKVNGMDKKMEQQAGVLSKLQEASASNVTKMTALVRACDEQTQLVRDRMASEKTVASETSTETPSVTDGAGSSATAGSVAASEATAETPSVTDGAGSSSTAGSVAASGATAAVDDTKSRSAPKSQKDTAASNEPDGVKAKEAAETVKDNKGGRKGDKISTEPATTTPQVPKRAATAPSATPSGSNSATAGSMTSSEAPAAVGGTSSKSAQKSKKKRVSGFALELERQALQAAAVRKAKNEKAQANAIARQRNDTAAASNEQDGSKGKKSASAPKESLKDRKGGRKGEACKPHRGRGRGRGRLQATSSSQISFAITVSPIRETDQPNAPQLHIPAVLDVPGLKAHPMSRKGYMLIASQNISQPIQFDAEAGHRLVEEIRTKRQMPANAKPTEDKLCKAICDLANRTLTGMLQPLLPRRPLFLAAPVKQQRGDNDDPGTFFAAQPEPVRSVCIFVMQLFHAQSAGKTFELAAADAVVHMCAEYFDDLRDGMDQPSYPC